MDWAVGCHLDRDKTIEKVSSRFYWQIIQKVEMNIKKAQERTNFTMAKNIDIIIFVCHILENTILDR